MPIIQQITDSQARDFVKKGEFGEEIISSKPVAVLLLTQSWCPRSQSMLLWLEELNHPDLAIWSFFYDKSDFFKDFLEFKERTLGNQEIPYLRYYSKGKFVTDTNYVERERFLNILKFNY